MNDTFRYDIQNKHDFNKMIRKKDLNGPLLLNLALYCILNKREVG